MTQEKIKRIHQCYGWILAAMIAVVGVLFIWACLGIYNSGPRPYSVEAIFLGFRRISIPVYITLVGILGGIVLNILLPLQQKRSKAALREEALLARLVQQTGTTEVAKKEIILRRMLRSGTALLYALLMISPTVYLLSPKNFTVENLNGDIIRAVLVVLLPSLLGLGLCWLCQLLLNASMRREIAQRKQLLAQGKRVAISESGKSSSPRTVWCIRGCLLALAIILIVLGIINGGMSDVLKKAIAICTECIGLG